MQARLHIPLLVRIWRTRFNRILILPKQTIRLCIAMAAFWLLLSGYFKTNLLVLGLISIAATVYFSIRMKVLNHKGQEIYFPFVKLIPYWGWLFIEILKSNIQVSKMFLTPSMPIQPLLKLVPADQKTEVGRVVFANSITLTPGTVAINMAYDGNIIVHALHKNSIAELERGEMNRRVMQLEKSMANHALATQHSLTKQDKL